MKIATIVTIDSGKDITQLLRKSKEELIFNRLLSNDIPSGYACHHMYLVTDDEAQIGDYCYNIIAKQILIKEYDSNDYNVFSKSNKKIAATTDSSLLRIIKRRNIGSNRDPLLVIGKVDSNILEISPEFIKEYVDKKGHLHVILLDYKDNKINSDEAGYVKFFNRHAENFNSDLYDEYTKDGLTPNIRKYADIENILSDCWKAAQDAMEKNGGHRTMTQPFQKFLEKLNNENTTVC
jgi:hypothetical protein